MKAARVSTVGVSRRHFLQTSAAGAGGLVLAFSIPLSSQAASEESPRPESQELNAWVMVRPMTRSSFELFAPRWVKAR